MPIKSQRKDGLGHWPAGKRRHRDKGDWSRIRLQLWRLLDDHTRRGQISGRALADELSVSPRTVGRWIRGIDRPAEAMQSAIQQWVAEWRDRIKAENATAG